MRVLMDSIELVNRVTTLEGTVRSLELAVTRMGELVDRVRALEARVRALEVQHCEDCGAEVPHGQGLGVSEPEETWTDRSKPRGITLTPLCKSCQSKRLAK